MLINNQGLNEFESSLLLKNGLDLQLPELEPLHYDPPDDPATSESFFSFDDVADAEVLPDPALPDVEDIWHFAGADEPLARPQYLKTWEHFYNRKFKESTPYISETSPRVFDALIAHGLTVPNDEDDGVEKHVIHPAPLLAALLQLGMGRESSMFSYDFVRQSFGSPFGDLRMSGYTPEIFKNVTAKFNAYGNQFVRLQNFVDKVYDDRTSCATLIALAATVSSIKSLMLEYLGSRAGTVRSLLQLQSIFDRPGQLLACISDLISKISATREEVEILSVVYQFAQDSDLIDSWTRSLFLQILSRTSRPWLESLTCCLGLQLHNTIPSKIKLLFYDEDGNDSMINKDIAQNECSFPDFIAGEDVEKIRQISQGLTLIGSASPGHVLSGPTVGEAHNTPKIEWGYEWSGIKRIEAKAKAYQVNILQAMSTSYAFDKAFKTAEPIIVKAEVQNFDPFQIPEDIIQAHVQEEPLVRTELPPRPAPEPYPDLLRQALSQAFSEDADPTTSSSPLPPPLSITAHLSFSPLLSTQARLINLATLRLLFNTHHLRHHLCLQRSYHLFGDGIFTSRLTHALFSPDLASAERRKGRSRTGTLGIKLGVRNSWPPASSELRLALMGILSESYKAAFVPPLRSVASSWATDVMIDKRDGELPGGLSFAIRDISDKEIEKCMNPDSIQALDFLRLQYRPPSPIDAVITTSSLQRYDAMFKLLLRMTRMLFVVTQLSRNNVFNRHRTQATACVTDLRKSQFCFEAQHFVSTVCGYFFDIAIGSTWDRFEANMKEIEDKLDNDEVALEVSVQEGLHRLKERHEEMLERMMFALLLRKRQERALEALEDVCGLVLDFARMDKEGGYEDAGKSEKGRDLYGSFRDKVTIFIQICKGLVEKDVSGSKQLGRGAEGTGMIEQLLLRLGMNGYYSKSSVLV